MHLPQLRKLCPKQSFFFTVILATLGWCGDPEGGREAAPVFPTDYLASLQAASDAQRLHEHPHWRKLLHYPVGKRKSDIDGGYFFLSPEGRTDSRAELAATLRAFLSEEDLSPPLDSALAEAKMHPLCRFRARLLFLQQNLDMPDSTLAQTDCTRFFRWRKALDPKGASLIFASSYLNNPASMFGHTFLRLNTHAGGSQRSILNYGITYAAAVPDNDGLLFAYKGLSGWYRGNYTMVPYYLSLQKYSNLESRDIWEYDLTMDSNQIEFLLGHIWEVGAAWMEYYFFDENCSYNIITLLDAADPDWNLSGELGYLAVVPAETVRLVLEKKGLVKESRWRPSLLTSFRKKTDSLPARDRKLLRKLMHSDGNPDSLAKANPGIPEDTLALLVDAALDYVQYRKRRATGRKADAWGSRQRALLMARSGLPRISIGGVSPGSNDIPPEAGHDSQLLGLKAGAADFRPFTELTYRFAYHDMSAREAGFLPGSSIEALKLRLRLTCEKECRDGIRTLEVHNFDLLSITSLPAMDRLLRSASWALRIGYDTRLAERARLKDEGRRLWGDQDRVRYFTAEGGAGLSTAWTPGWQFQPYLLALAKARYFPFGGQAVDLGPQVKVGLRTRVGQSFSVLAEHRRYWPLVNRQGDEADFSAEFRQSWTKDSDLRLGMALQDGLGELSLGWNGYF